MCFQFAELARKEGGGRGGGVMTWLKERKKVLGER